jgi:hypothetical protein
MNVGSKKEWIFLFLSTTLLLFFGSQMRETENVHIYPVCFPNICWHSGLNNQWKYV